MFGNQTNEVITVESFFNYQSLLWIVLSGFICALNTFSIGVIIWQRKKKRIQCHLYIVSLATADLLVGLVAAVVHAVYAVQSQIDIGSTDATTCIITGTIFWTFINESLNHLTLISIDRMVSVVWPLKYRTYTQSSMVWLFVGIIWALSVLEGLISGLCAFYITLNTDVMNVNDITCTSGGLLATKYQGFHFYMWIRFVLAYIVILGSYSYMVIAHQKHIKQVYPVMAQSSFQTTKSARKTLRQRKELAAARKSWKLGRAVMIPFLAVSVSFLPRMVYHFTASLELGILPSSYLNFATVMVVLNSAVNPCLYVKCIPELTGGVVNALRATRDIFKFKRSNSPDFEIIS